MSTKAPWRPYRNSIVFKSFVFTAGLLAFSSLAQAGGPALTVYQDPNCGCCDGWAQHMRDSGFDVTAIKTRDMAQVKQRLGVPVELASCHTAVIETTGQRVEGHVPANVVRRMMTDMRVKGVAAPGMPQNAPGMGELDGNLITLDFNGQPYSRD